METILEVSDRNGFEAWRRLVREMERDTVNRKLAVIEAFSRPDLVSTQDSGDNVGRDGNGKLSITCCRLALR